MADWSQYEENKWEKYRAGTRVPLVKTPQARGPLALGGEFARETAKAAVIPPLVGAGSRYAVEHPAETAEALTFMKYPVPMALGAAGGRLAEEAAPTAQKRLSEMPIPAGGLTTIAARKMTPTQFKTTSRIIGQLAGGATGAKLQKTIAPVARKLFQKITPRIMGTNWLVTQSKLGHEVADGVDDALSNSYKNMYSKINHVKVNPNDVDDILLNTDYFTPGPEGQMTNMKDIVLKEIDQAVGGGRIDTVQKAKIVSDILRRRVPRSYYNPGGRIGKGGIANPNIRAMNAHRRVKDIIAEGVEAVDKRLATELKNLNKQAHDKVYPLLDKFRGVFGRKGTPETKMLAPVYKGAVGEAYARQTIRKAPETAGTLFEFIEPQYKADLTKAIINANQLVKNMGKFRGRQLLKWGAGIGASALAGKYLYGRMRSGESSEH